MSTRTNLVNTAVRRATAPRLVVVSSIVMMLACCGTGSGSSPFSGAGSSNGGSSNGGATSVSTGGAAATGTAGSGAKTGGASSGGRAGSGGTSNLAGAANSAGTSATGGVGATGGTGGTIGTGGAGGTGGTTGTTCATANENATATLTCPAGEVIDDVIFASYGTPSGSCGSFTSSNCAAQTSTSVVRAACVGKSSCTIAATNATFGDPCSGTTKRLYIESHCTPGAAGTGGTNTGGTSGTGGTGTGGTNTGGTSATCGATPNPIPFNCRFAWGLNGVNPANYPYIQFVSNWAGWSMQANGTLSSCDQCNWLKNTMANASQVPVLIAYFIGYYGHANGLPDGNQNPNGPNLTNGMGALLLGVANAGCPSGVICENNLMVKAYAWYAQQVYAAYKRPVIWWMEGDFVQYSPEGSQTVPISWDQTGQLAGQITRAIKCNDPAAVIAWNYSTWISTAERDSYFNAINSNVAKLGTSYEMVFTTGKGNTANAGTGTTWDQLYAVAGNKPIMCDESFGLSVQGDT